MPECEACKNGIGEPWEKFTENLTDSSQVSLERALIVWWKRTVDYRLAGCRKHAEEASDRRDYVSVERDTRLFSSGKITPNQWLEGRNKERERELKFWHPSGVHDPPHSWEHPPRTLVAYRKEELERFCYGWVSEK